MELFVHFHSCIKINKQLQNWNVLQYTILCLQSILSVYLLQIFNYLQFKTSKKYDHLMYKCTSELSFTSSFPFSMSCSLYILQVYCYSKLNFAKKVNSCTKTVLCQKTANKNKITGQVFPQTLLNKSKYSKLLALDF